jgi:hypothetical protein
VRPREPGKEGRTEPMRPNGEGADIAALFDWALGSAGPAYLRAERELLARGTAAAEAFRAGRRYPDPVGRLLAEVLLGWSEGQAPEYQQALDYLEALAKFTRTSVMRVPPISGVAAELTRRFGDRAVDLLLLRLLKEGGLPDWRVVSTLLYVKEHASPRATEALVRFAADTPNQRWRSVAVEVVASIADPALPDKIAAERRRVEARGGQLPAAVAALGRPGTPSRIA